MGLKMAGVNSKCAFELLTTLALEFWFHRWVEFLVPGVRVRVPPRDGEGDRELVFMRKHVPECCVCTERDLVNLNLEFLSMLNGRIIIIGFATAVL